MILTKRQITHGVFGVVVGGALLLVSALAGGLNAASTLAIASTLMQIAHTLRLLGCVVYLSGVASDIATSLVQLGTSFDGITPIRSPQEALAHFTTRASVAAAR